MAATSAGRMAWGHASAGGERSRALKQRRCRPVRRWRCHLSRSRRLLRLIDAQSHSGTVSGSGAARRSGPASADIYMVMVQTCGTRTCVSDAPRCLQAPSIPDAGRSSALNTQTPQVELAFLAFPDAVHQLNTGDRDHSISELPESLHHSNALLDASMVLFNQPIEVFRPPQPRLRRHATISLQLAHRAARRLVATQRDRWWRTLHL